VSDGLPFAPTIDELATALAQDPVIVTQAFGNGHTAQADDELHQLVDDLEAASGVPVYVVVARGPDGLAVGDPLRDLATNLHTRLAETDALYVLRVDTGDGVRGDVVGFGDAPDTSVLNAVDSQFAPDGGTDAGVSEVGLAARDLGVLLQGPDIPRSEYDAYRQEVVWRSPPQPSYEDFVPPQAGTYATFGTMAFVTVAVGSWLVLRNVARWRTTAPDAARVEARRRAREVRAGRAAPGQNGTSSPAARADRVPAVPASVATPAALRRTVDAELERLAATLERTAGTALDDERRQLADGSYDTARSLVDRLDDTPVGTPDDGDVPDLVGALVLTRTAERALDGGSRRRRPPSPYRPCFFDPRHGEGTARRTVAVGSGELEVPACAACRRATTTDLRPLETLVGGRFGRRRRRAYYELDDVWARTGFGALVDDLWVPVSTDLRQRRSGR